MYKKLGFTALGAVLLAGFAAADDHGGGEAIYLDKCANCHFEDDFSGESAEAIAGMIKGIKSGETKHGADLSGLSDEDIKKLAEYYASQ
jgi:cytochrome c553